MHRTAFRLSLFLLLSLSFFIPIPSLLLAQDIEDTEEWRVIYTDSEVDTLVYPDEVVFFLSIESSHLSIDSARFGHQKKLEKLKDLAGRMKVNPADIRMDNMDIEPDYLMSGEEGTDFNPRAFSSNSSEPNLQEYHAIRTVTVTLRDLSKYTDFLAEVLKLDIDLVRSPLYRFSNSQSIRTALTLKAMQEARLQANLLVKEAGLVLGKPLRIEFISWYDPSEYVEASKGYNSYSYTSTDASQIIRPDMISMNLSIRVAFQMLSGD